MILLDGWHVFSWETTREKPKTNFLRFFHRRRSWFTRVHKAKHFLQSRKSKTINQEENTEQVEWQQYCHCPNSATKYLFESYYQEREDYIEVTRTVAHVFSCSISIQGLGWASLCSWWLQMRASISKHLVLHKLNTLTVIFQNNILCCPTFLIEVMVCAWLKTDKISKKTA